MAGSQLTVLLLQISLMQEKCNLVSTFSVCVHSNQSRFGTYYIKEMSFVSINNAFFPPILIEGKTNTWHFNEVTFPIVTKL